MQITFTVTNNNPETIYNKLAARLGGEPTLAEIKAEVQRIIRDARGLEQNAHVRTYFDFAPTPHFVPSDECEGA